MLRISCAMTSLMIALSSMQCSSAGATTMTNAVSSATIALPAGSYSAVSLLAAAVNGAQFNQTFLVTYTDGTTSSFTQSLSDWGYPQNFAGETQVATMAYRVTAPGATADGPWYVYGYSFALDAAKTVKSLTLPHNRNVVVLGVDLGASPVRGGTPVSVNLSTVRNVIGIANEGAPAASGGLDADGYAYCASLLGTSLAWGGVAFTLGAANALDAVNGRVITLPAAHDSTLNLLAAAVNGSQANQTFVVAYTDGTSTSFSQSLSDWYVPQDYPGESQASKMPYRIGPSGAMSPGPVYLYGYSLAIDSAKTVKSLALPNNRNVVVLAAGLGATAVGGPAPVHVNLSTADNVVGIASNGSPVSNGGLDGSGNAYSANLTGASISWSGASFVLGTSGSVETAVTEPSTSAELSWSPPTQNTNGTPLTNLSGYVIRYGMSAAALTMQLSVASANATDAEISNLTPGTWFFEVAAVNAANLAGPFSALVSDSIQ